MSKNKRQQQGGGAPDPRKLIVAIDLDTAQFRRQKAAREALWAVILHEDPWFDPETKLWTINKAGCKITDTSPERVMVAFEGWMKQAKEETYCGSQEDTNTTTKQDGDAGEVPQV